MSVGSVSFPFGLCRICSDGATGVHYGVESCEGCKGFFKRTITRGDNYRCYFGGNCDINPENRNRCKACRFRRCSEAGMALDAVKMGRIPKVNKLHALEANNHKLETIPVPALNKVNNTVHDLSWQSDPPSKLFPQALATELGTITSTCSTQYSQRETCRDQYSPDIINVLIGEVLQKVSDKDQQSLPEVSTWRDANQPKEANKLQPFASQSSARMPDSQTSGQKLTNHYVTSDSELSRKKNDMTALDDIVTTTQQLMMSSDSVPTRKPINLTNSVSGSRPELSTRESIKLDSEQLHSAVSIEQPANFLETIDGLNVAYKHVAAVHEEMHQTLTNYMNGKVFLEKPQLTTENISKVWNLLFASIPEENERIVGYCSSIPGFKDLSLEDREVILKLKYYDVWMLQAAQFLHDGQSFLVLKNCMLYTREIMIVILTEKLVQLMFRFSQQINECHLDTTEMSILCAVMLTSPDDVPLVGKLDVEKLNSHFLDVFSFIMVKNHPDCSSRLLFKVFRALSLLPKINQLFQEVILGFSHEEPPQVSSTVHHLKLKNYLKCEKTEVKTLKTEKKEDKGDGKGDDKDDSENTTEQ